MQQRILLYVIGGILLGFIQKLLLDRLAIYGAKPDAILLLLVWISRREGQSFGTTAGFTIGLFMDLLHGTLGIDAFSKTIVGFVAGYFANPDDAQKLSNFLWATALAAFLGTSANELISTALQAPFWKWTFLATLTTAYNFLFGYLFFQVVRRYG